MGIITQVTDIMQDVFENAAETASLACDFVQRKRKPTAAAFAKILVFGWLENPDASYTALPHTARALDIDVSRQAIEKRMTFEAAKTLFEIRDSDKKIMKKIYTRTSKVT